MYIYYIFSYIKVCIYVVVGVEMVKKEIIGIDLFDNPRYFCVFSLIKLTTDKKKIIRYKHLKYSFVKNHGDIDTSNKRLMKDIMDVLKFEDVDRKKSKYSLDRNKEVSVLTDETIKYFQKVEPGIKDYGAFFRKMYIIQFCCKKCNYIWNTAQGLKDKKCPKCSSNKIKVIEGQDNFIFKSKNLLSNTLNILINREIIAKSDDKKGNYYYITNYGLNLFYRYGCKHYAKNLPDEKIVLAYKKLEEIARS